MPVPIPRPYLLLDMRVSMQHETRGYSILPGLQGHIEAEHNGAQLVPEVGLVLEGGQESDHAPCHTCPTDHPRARSTQPMTQGWRHRLAQPALPVPSPGVLGGRPRWCGRWGSASRPGPDAAWCPPVGNSAAAPAGPGAASAGPAAARHLGLARQAGSVRVSLASLQGSPDPPPFCPHDDTHAAAEECCAQWLLHTSVC